jgi:hypothetical protein
LFFRDPTALAYFADPDMCEAKPAGTIVTNEDRVDVMKALAKHGADAFYEGEIAAAIAEAVHNDPAIPGDMTAPISPHTTSSSAPRSARTTGDMTSVGWARRRRVGRRSARSSGSWRTSRSRARIRSPRTSFTWSRRPGDWRSQIADRNL